MRIALMGTRGIPADGGAPGRFYEELGVRLAAHGHRVTWYDRPGAEKDGHESDRGMHTLLSTFYGGRCRHDIVCLFTVANSPWALLPRAYGAKVVMTAHGPDRCSSKEGLWTRCYRRLTEKLAARFLDALVVDSPVMLAHYSERFGVEPVYIPCGCPEAPAVNPEFARGVLSAWGLESKKYILFSGPLVPEDCAHHVTNAFALVGDRRGMKLVVAGDAPQNEQEYVALLKARAGKDVIFTGRVSGEHYPALSEGAYAFVLAAATGGTHPVLVEQMGFGKAIVANGAPGNLFALGGAGLAYDGRKGAPALAATLDHLIEHPEKAERLGEMAQRRARTHFSWHRVTHRYEKLFSELLEDPTQTAMLHQDLATA